MAKKPTNEGQPLLEVALPLNLKLNSNIIDFSLLKTH